MSDEYVTTSRATRMLRISTWKMAELLRDGTLKWIPDPFNKRRKLILKADVEKLMALRPKISEEEEEKDVAALVFA